jgi:hypothetical protein
VDFAADANRKALSDPLPDLFITFQQISPVPAQSADDVETLREVDMQLSIFSRTGLTNLPDTDTAMGTVGFRYTGETPIPYNDKTEHYGVAREYVKLYEL